MAIARYEIREFGDVVEAGATIRAGQPAEVSISGVLADVAQRVIDFFAGVAVSGSATMTRISPSLFLITPPAPPNTKPLVSLPRPRPLTNVTVPALAKLNPLGRRRDRAFWPETRRG
jgi:hypothetical protein